MAKVNPFTPNSPVHKSMFIGRSYEIDTIDKALLQTKHSNPRTAVRISSSQPANNNFMRKKVSKTNRSVAKIVGTFENAAAMGAELRQALVKCMMPCAHSVERRLKFRSSRAMTGRFCAGTASPQAADNLRRVSYPVN